MYEVLMPVHHRPGGRQRYMDAPSGQKERRQRDAVIDRFKKFTEQD